MTIEIPISPDYRLTSDVHNIIVNERYFTDPTKAPGWARRLAENPDADPTPVERWREVSYHPTIDRAVLDVMNRRIKTSDAASLAEIAQMVREFRRELAAALTLEGANTTDK
ncbi:hypothetical protein [Bacillus pumilus]|uniref:Uncharacterized protein n=1 Tax=Bacillus pumilus TaxID=1408 RepID=A0AAE3WLF7_BACPU|nr:hypothetical protein [Bacillus pumilus]MDF9460580.1 hypothetical protein [Bacillus pumilus]MDR4250773.1 hypothetical protein [Bacillus pumilus]